MLLAVDTSGPHCTAVLYDEEHQSVLACASENIGRGHAERLTGMVEELLTEAKSEWSEVSAIGSTTGPGSFTGLRVGLAAARGFALALSCPIVGVSVFQALRFDHLQGSLTIVQDAKRDQVWMQSFKANEPTGSSEPIAIRIEDAGSIIPKDIEGLAGSGASMLATDRPLNIVLSQGNVSPKALAKCCAFALKQSHELYPAKPLYLRAPDAKPQPQAFVVS